MPNIRTRKLPIHPDLAQVFPMFDRPRRNAIALCAWLFAVVAVGSWSAHFFYNGGMALAEVARHKPINAPLDWLAGICREASFADAHRFGIIFTAVLAALPFLARQLRKPDGPLRLELAEARNDRPGMRKAVLAFALCVAISLSLAFLFQSRDAIDFPAAWFRWVVAASLVGLAVETMFRGIAMRVFSHAMGDNRAIFASAAAYLLFFCALFPRGIDDWIPALSSERFPLARAMASGLTDPAHVFGQFLPLLLLGISLAWARTRSSSLWLVLGVQTGVLLGWGMTSHPVPALLAALPTVYVFCGCPRFRTLKPS